MKRCVCGLLAVVVGMLSLSAAAQDDSSAPPPGMSVPLSERVIFQPGPYELTGDSRPREGVPRGTISRHVFSDSVVYPGTLHEYWVYIPAQYDPEGETPAALMVFQDGHAYVGDDSNFRATTVMDNLIAAGDIPVTIGLFIEPGHRGDELPEAYWNRRNNRSVEYDTPDDTYAQFLIEEMIPLLAERVRISDDPAMRAICGTSSGGICAFKCAWHRPDAFGKVLSTIGSFVNIRGGHAYPAILRKEEARPIRVFLQDGMADLDNQHGNWWLANQAMARSLAYEDRYDYRFVAGVDGHSSRHGAAVFPDAMRWLWRGWDEPVE